jgi:[ribosomal protein S5]-alanine N-acetyltransferase
VRRPEALAGDGVALRALREDDAPAYAAAFRDDPELGRLLGVESDPDEAAVRARIAGAEQRAGFELAITANGSDALRGVVAVHSIEADHGRAEVGFWLASQARGAGLGARAVSLVIGWLFEEEGLRRIEMTTTPDNGAALVLARRLGFTQEGVLRQRAIERGRAVDIVWLGLLRDEWPARRSV